MADINVMLLVDVMLVVLLIRMMTAPMLTHRNTPDLPQRNESPPPLVKPPALHLTIQADDARYLHQVPISQHGLKLQLGVYGNRLVGRQPELQIAASHNAGSRCRLAWWPPASAWACNITGSGGWITDNGGVALSGHA